MRKKKCAIVACKKQAVPRESDGMAFYCKDCQERVTNDWRSY